MLISTQLKTVDKKLNNLKCNSIWPIKMLKIISIAYSLALN